MTCRVEGCGLTASTMPPLCPGHVAEYIRSGEATRARYWSNRCQSVPSAVAAANIAFVDWLSRVNAERRNG